MKGLSLLTVAGLASTALAAIKPKVFIIDMYSDEGAAWWGHKEINLLAHNITIPGLSLNYPAIHCTSSYDVCQIIADEGEINSAVTITSLWHSSTFNLTETYFLIGGDAGINPKHGTLGSVAFARFAVQVALQYEIDPREIPKGWKTGYVPQGATNPEQYPTFLYGTEVFELNDALRQKAMTAARKAHLNDSLSAQEYRKTYGKVEAYLKGTQGPSIIACDTATSDNWFSGLYLADAFETTTKLFTNGEASYCTTQQEDNAVLGSLIRGAVNHKIDFSRIMSMRTGSDFDRGAPGQSATDNLFNGQDAGYDAAVQNIFLAGIKVVEEIVDHWEGTYEKGVKASNYVGDIAGSLGKQPPFVPKSYYDRKRSLAQRVGRHGRRV